MSVMSRFLSPFRWLRVLVISCVLASAAIAGEGAVDGPGLTFFGWSDQHVTVGGQAEHLLPALDAMSGLAGTPYPERFGGVVARPAFVFGCGDVTEWPTRAAVKAYDYRQRKWSDQPGKVLDTAIEGPR